MVVPPILGNANPAAHALLKVSRIAGCALIASFVHRRPVPAHRCRRGGGPRLGNPLLVLIQIIAGLWHHF